MSEESTSGSSGQSTGQSTGESTRRRQRIAPYAVILVAVVMAGLFVLLASADPARNKVSTTPLLNLPAPTAIGVTADGRSFDLSQRKGSWVVINFFTSTCIPCQREHPDLIEFVEQQRRLGTAGAEFYTIVVDDTVEAVERFFAREGGDWPIIYDGDGRFAVAFGVAQVPETWIIDPNGIVRGRLISQVTAEFLGQQIQRIREGL
jgi:cytochrome c biogenesis protein CcmG/thiol:disulfide interchange protein DsbE